MKSLLFVLFFFLVSGSSLSVWALDDDTLKKFDESIEQLQISKQKAKISANYLYKQLDSSNPSEKILEELNSIKRQIEGYNKQILSNETKKRKFLETLAIKEKKCVSGNCDQTTGEIRPQNRSEAVISISNTTETSNLLSHKNEVKQGLLANIKASDLFIFLFYSLIGIFLTWVANVIYVKNKEYLTNKFGQFLVFCRPLGIQIQEKTYQVWFVFLRKLEVFAQRERERLAEIQRREAEAQRLREIERQRVESQAQARREQARRAEIRRQERIRQRQAETQRQREIERQRLAAISTRVNRNYLHNGEIPPELI